MMRAVVVITLVVLGATVGVRSRVSPPQTIVRASTPDTPQTAEDRGRLVYGGYGCAMCHGADGTGGFANPNAQTEGRVPAVVFVAEGYTRGELRDLILKGIPSIGKADPDGLPPPYRMPGWRGVMTEAEAKDLVEYLFSLYPEAAQEKWR